MRNREEKGYDAGWEEGKSSRKKWKKQQREKNRRNTGGSGDSDTNNSGSGSFWPLGVVFGALVIGGGLCAANLTSVEKWLSRDSKRIIASHNPSRGSGSTMYVNTKMLNIRSGPGPNFPVVREAYNGERLLVYGEAKNVNGERWGEVIGDDQSTRGWVNLKLISDRSFSPDPPSLQVNFNNDAQNFETPVNPQSEIPKSIQADSEIRSSLTPTPLPTYDPTPNDYNSPENRRRRKEVEKRAEESRLNDPKIKQEAIERERRRQRELQETYDRLNRKYGNQRQ